MCLKPPQVLESGTALAKRHSHTALDVDLDLSESSKSEFRLGELRLELQGE